MILADKILLLRKNNGWSQEEFAEKMQVSRQAVSKWESAAAIPDINRILELSRLFGVSTDYLLRDDIETAEYTDADPDGAPKVSLPEMKAFLEAKARSGVRVAQGVVLCILSPALLIFLNGLAEAGLLVSENLASGLGLGALLLMVAGAVGIFITDGGNMERFRYLEESAFELEYGLSGIVRTERENSRQSHQRSTVGGVTLCILSALPLVLAGVFEAGDLLLITLTALLLVIVSAGVYLLIVSGTVRGSYDLLLGEGEYTPKERERSKRVSRFAGVYWPVVTAVYLGWSFVSYDWHFTWVVWPVAGLVFAAAAALLGAFRE